MVDTLDQFKKIIENKENLELASRGTYYLPNGHIDEQFCPYCGGVRKCELSNMTFNNYYTYSEKDMAVFRNPLPYVYEARCLQCDHRAVLVIYEAAEQEEMAVLRDTYGGCITPNTPDEVKYYIDQAFRSRSVGAYSAAMTMYRSALEWVIHDQGYTNGMLGKKIGDLQNDISKGTAPKWTMEIGTDFLEAIKEIGNGAIHTNGGDISKQKEIDKDLIEVVDIVFAELLDKIYEQPSRSNKNLSRLQQVVAHIKK